MKLLATALIFAACALPAGDPPGFFAWKSTDLKAFTKSLAPKINEQKVGTQQLGLFGNYSFMMAHREGSGEAELHETQADVMVIESGEATLIYGGQVVGGKTTAAGEIRGTSISGGTEKKLAPGDVLTVPAKTAHMMKLEPGKQLTYFMVKITQ